MLSTRINFNDIKYRISPSLEKHFNEISLHFRIYGDFEADNKIDNCCVGKKTTSVYKQYLVCEGYYIMPDLNDVLTSGYCETPLGYDNLYWFVEEVIKLENKMAFHFKSNKDIIFN